MRSRNTFGPLCVLLAGRTRSIQRFVVQFQRFFIVFHQVKEAGLHTGAGHHRTQIGLGVAVQRLPLRGKLVQNVAIVSQLASRFINRIDPCRTQCGNHIIGHRRASVIILHKSGSLDVPVACQNAVQAAANHLSSLTGTGRNHGNPACYLFKFQVSSLCCTAYLRKSYSNFICAGSGCITQVIEHICSPFNSYIHGVHRRRQILRSVCKFQARGFGKLYGLAQPLHNLCIIQTLTVVTHSSLCNLGRSDLHILGKLTITAAKRLHLCLSSTSHNTDFGQKGVIFFYINGRLTKRIGNLSRESSNHIRQEIPCHMLQGMSQTISMPLALEKLQIVLSLLDSKLIRQLSL